MTIFSKKLWNIKMPRSEQPHVLQAHLL